MGDVWAAAGLRADEQITIRRFEKADDSRVFEKGRFDLVTSAG